MGTILGLPLPLFLYFLVKKIFHKKKLAVLSALSLGFLPWYLYSLLMGQCSWRGGSYFYYFSPDFLAFEGNWAVPYFGMIGYVNFILLLIGLGYFLSQKHRPKEYLFFLAFPFSDYPTKFFYGLWNY